MNSTTPLALAHPLIVMVIGLALLALWRIDTLRPRYLIYFSVSYLSYSVGVTAQILLVPAAHGLNVMLSGVCYMLAVAMLAQGLIALADAKPQFGVPIAILVIGIAGRLYYTFGVDNGVARLYWLQAVVFFMLLHGAWLARGLRQAPTAERVAYYALVLFTLSTGPRTLLQAYRPVDSYGFDLSFYWVASKLSVSAFTLVFGLALIFAIVQRYVRSRRLSHETLSVISHDLQAPLATIVGNLRSLEKTATPEQKAHMQAIEHSTRYQYALIQDILNSKADRNQLLSINIEALSVQTFLSELYAHGQAWCADRGNTFSIDIQTQLPAYIETDERRLKQLLLNLLSNAALETEAGKLTLRVRHLAKEPTSVRLQFDVVDTGNGIEPQHISRLFQAHGRINTKRTGNGLGLYIAKRIADDLGATLSVQSEPGRGSCFTLDLQATADWSASVVQGWQVAAAATTRQPARDKPACDARPCRELAIYARGGRYSDLEVWVESAKHRQLCPADFISTVKDALDRLDFDHIQKVAGSRCGPSSN